ncbi:MAG: glycosyltransferase [Pirellulales bacterium]
MRILLTSHDPLDAPGPGRLVDEWSRRLAAGGHQVRVLCVEGLPHDDAEPYIRSIFCHPTDRRAPLPLVRPSLLAGVAETRPFTALNDRDLGAYRDLLRVELDREIDLYDPCVVHVQHLWLFGHLALEAGVPYVVSAHAQEFAAERTDKRFRRYMQEAAENACRIFAHDASARSGVADMVGDLEGRVVAPPPGVESLPDLYRTALHERFGRLPPHCDR